MACMSFYFPNLTPLHLTSSRQTVHSNTGDQHNNKDAIYNMVEMSLVGLQNWIFICEILAT